MALIGIPTRFDMHDSIKDRTRKLNDITKNLFKKLNSIKTFGHTSFMPDSTGSNRDHDSRYYTKSEIKALLNTKADIN